MIRQSARVIVRSAMRCKPGRRGNNPTMAAPKRTLAAAAGAIAFLAILFAVSTRPSGCGLGSVNLDLALDRSRSAILQGSAGTASDRCAAYRAHTALLEGKRKCVGGRELSTLSSELAAYEELTTKTCS